MNVLRNSCFAATVLAFALLVLPNLARAAGGNSSGDDVSWNFHGKNKENTADSTGETKITKNNIDKLEIKWIYKIDELQGGRNLVWRS